MTSVCLTCTPDTDFLAAGGVGNHAWNIIRSEADDLLFRHAGESGARIFDGVKVTSLGFAPGDGKNGTKNAEGVDLGRPISASWSRKDGHSGTIRFEYLIDASGRAGIVSTKYIKNRRYNPGLKNIATWGYWEGAGTYGVGTRREGAPFFEAFQGISCFCE